MEVVGRSALVTGGAHRIGRAIALALADAGANVFVHYNRSAAQAEEVAAAIRDRGVMAATGTCDLADLEAVGSLVQVAEEALGPLSVLVNSASGFSVDTLVDVSPQQWRQTIDLTLGGPLFLTQAFANAIPEPLDGAIVNVTDVKTMRPYRKHFSYMLAKGGLDTLTRAAAVALAPRIRVNAVALGVILPPPGENEFYVDQLAADLPLQRVGGAEPVASAVVEFIKNDFITGEIIRIDGGGHLV